MSKYKSSLLSVYMYPTLFVNYYMYYTIVSAYIYIYIFCEDCSLEDDEPPVKGALKKWIYSILASEVD